MAAPRGSYEVRTRVTFFLPTNNAPEEKAIFDVINYLEQQRTRRVSVTGYTHSRLRTPVFRGGWWAGNDWAREGVALFVVDYLREIGDRALDQALTRLKQAIANAYSRHGGPQLEIWLLAQEAIRYT